MEKFLKTIDHISGKIDLKYKGLTGYKNWFAGVLSLSIYLLTFAVSIYFFRNMFDRIDPKSYTVKKYVESGGVTLDQKNLFHFFAFIDVKKNVPVEIEKEMFQIESYTMFVSKKKIIKYKYEKCTYDDFIGLEHLFSEDFKNFSCLRSMVDLRENENNQTIISNLVQDKISDKIQINPHFIYPWMTIEKSNRVEDIIYFEIDIAKCQNSTEKSYVCKTDDEINAKLDSLYFQLKFIDNMFNVGNYLNPVNNYINNKNSALKGNTLVNLWLNFYAVNIITHDGLIFDQVQEINTYAFDFHSEAFATSNKPLVHQTQFYILNNSQNYERSYSRLQNVAADIGGIHKFFFMIGSILNLIFENYSNNVINENLFEILKIDFNEKKKSAKISLRQNFSDKRRLDGDVNKNLNYNDKKQNSSANENNVLECSSNKIEDENKIKGKFSQIKKHVPLEDYKNKLKSKNMNEVISVKSCIQTRNQTNFNTYINSNVNLMSINKVIDTNCNKLNLEENKSLKKTEENNVLFLRDKMQNDKEDSFDIKRVKMLNENFKGFFNYIIHILKCKLSNKIRSVRHLRNVLLDEINLYILHLDVIRIKKYLIGDYKYFQNFLSVNVDLFDLTDNYISYSKD